MSRPTQITFRPGRTSYELQRQNFGDIQEEIEAARLDGRALEVALDDDGLGPPGTTVPIPGLLGVIDCGGTVTLRAKTLRGNVYNAQVNAGTVLRGVACVSGLLNLLGGLGGVSLDFDYPNDPFLMLRNGASLLLAPGATSPILAVPGEGYFGLDCDQGVTLDPTAAPGVPLFDLLTSGPDSAEMLIYAQGNLDYFSNLIVRGGAGTSLLCEHDSASLAMPFDPAVMLGTVSDFPIGDAQSTLYGPGAPGDWAGTPPSRVNQAIDRLAALARALNGGNPVP